MKASPPPVGLDHPTVVPANAEDESADEPQQDDQ